MATTTTTITTATTITTEHTYPKGPCPHVPSRCTASYWGVVTFAPSVEIGGREAQVVWCGTSGRVLTWGSTSSAATLRIVEGVDIATLSVGDLRRALDFEGVSTPKGAKKADLIELLEDLR